MPHWLWESVRARFLSGRAQQSEGNLSGHPAKAKHFAREIRTLILYLAGRGIVWLGKNYVAVTSPDPDGVTTGETPEKPKRDGVVES